MSRYALFATCLWMTLLGPAQGTAEENAVRPPNFLIILADDLGRELLDCYGGQSGYETPRINQLAADGMRFKHCYATPLCTPSRVEILTGRYSFRNYVAWGELEPGEITFANHLKDAGYATAFAGKWHLGGWSSKPPRIALAGFDEFCSYDSVQLLADSKRGLGNRFWGGTINRNGQQTKLDRYGPDVNCDFLVDFIRRHQDTPFLAYYCLTPMHRPFHPTPEHPDAPTAGEDPPQAWMGSRGDAQNYAAMLRYTDKLIGRLLDTLQEQGIAENTVVIFTSDNGTDNKGEAKTIRTKFRDRMVSGGKYFPIELGVNVPLIVHWPHRTTPGRVSEELVDLTDVLPTIRELAGVKKDEDYPTDGISLVPHLTGQAEHDKSFIYTWGNFDHSSKRYKAPANYAESFLHVVRDKNWKLYNDGRLFDLSHDFFEEHEIPAETDPTADAARNRLQKSLSELRATPPKKF
ncbi:Choline-sulfatase [Symmachiella macrocystis]|uniref:Choline-sulfatase n=1 Tax=Symmachiella macrocystis TaxID=2527985 RepID=A0A5C6BNA8_9PLAN|nr:sulfatase-like hydrolase/transferase [Symmachiella macrocystis]TWU12569.1 Choline-sulfatase [Symmachiella macrocystis]